MIIKRNFNFGASWLLFCKDFIRSPVERKLFFYAGSTKPGGGRGGWGIDISSPAPKIIHSFVYTTIPMCPCLNFSLLLQKLCDQYQVEKPTVSLHKNKWFSNLSICSLHFTNSQYFHLVTRSVFANPMCTYSLGMKGFYKLLYIEQNYSNYRRCGQDRDGSSL